MTVPACRHPDAARAFQPRRGCPQHRRRHHRRPLRRRRPPAGRCRTHGDVRRIAAGVARERQDPGGEGAAHHQGAGRHRGARARRLEHVRCRRAGLASRWRHRPALSQRSRRNPARGRAARRRARGWPPLGGRHRRTPPEHGANAGGGLPTPLVLPTAILPCIWPSPTPPAICSCARSAMSSRRRCAPRSCSARRSRRRTARRCCRGTSALSMRSRAAMPRQPPRP